MNDYRRVDAQDRRSPPSLLGPAGPTVDRAGPAPSWGDEQRRRILVIDDDPGLRLLLRTTFTADEFTVEEASSAEEATELLCRWEPTVVILDIGLPGTSGLAFCRELKDRRGLTPPAVILLTGADTEADAARAAGADALLHKPFSPIELVSVIDRLPGETAAREAGAVPAEQEQLIVYARDLGRLLHAERHHRRLLEHAYRATASALIDALEARDPHTGTHALRVQRYAMELTEAVDPRLLDDPSLEYGFLLHDIGKIAIPDHILNKPGPLSEPETQLMQQHPLVGAQILRDVALLDGQGIAVVRSHHERFDGHGYPDQLSQTDIPLGARIFAVADTFDAMTSDRPYRKALPWHTAVEEILVESRHQFDPHVVAAFADRHQHLRQVHDGLTPDLTRHPGAREPLSLLASTRLSTARART